MPTFNVILCYAPQKQQEKKRNRFTDSVMGFQFHFSLLLIHSCIYTCCSRCITLLHTHTHASNHMSVWLYFACWNLKNNWNDINGNKMGTTCDRNHFVSSLWVKQMTSEEWERTEGRVAPAHELKFERTESATHYFYSNAKICIHVLVPHSPCGNKHNMWVWVTNSMTAVGGCVLCGDGVKNNTMHNCVVYRFVWAHQDVPWVVVVSKTQRSCMRAARAYAFVCVHALQF